MTSFPRREFLKAGAAAGLAAIAAPASLRAAASNPLGRAGKPVLRLSLAAYSFRDTFPIMRGKPNPKVPAAKATDMFRFIDYCAAHGCDAEPTTYFFAEETEAYMIKLRRHAFLRGVAISGTAIGNNFSHPKGPKRDAEIALTKQWIDRAAALGAPHIRVFAGVTKEIPRDAADKLVVGALEECCDYAGKKGIFLGLENHDSIGSAATLLPMVKAVKSPWIGINLDSGNFRTADPYRDFAECVPYSVNVQFKSELQPAGGARQAADFKKLARLLRDGGYQGWVALEYEGKEDPATAVPRHLDEMRAAFA
ncbi:MAG: sugar phosphate isomerase/epimerase [Opitutaceae bacterium]|jgi:sugar phosphate isomerase/epimerase|nr:sugar phosphate isomerase/epimerase [Opitutaceae bacterium]